MNLNCDNIGNTAVGLHNQYINFRDPPVPFPPESVAFWCVLLSMQLESDICGNLLELGVEHGGTAFLSIAAARESETQTLVDLKKSDRFAAKFEELTPSLQHRTNFIEASTQSSNTDDLTKQKWRWMHIDAGHSYDAVKADMNRYAQHIKDDGILCCDDFFLNRWPEVTIAILDTYEAAGLVPIALVNRKAYFAQKVKAEYMRELIKSAMPAAERFGQWKHWEVTLRGAHVDFYQITTNAKVSSEIL